MKHMENRAIGCQQCGGMAHGRESSMKVREGILHECRWVCPRCGSLVRVHEELEPNEEK